jgi:hypothetical protein
MRYRRILLPAVSLLAVGLICPLAWAAQAEEKPAESKAAAAAALGPAETLSGKIALVEAKQKLVVVEGAGGVTYSFLVRPGTKITAAGQRLKLEELSARKGASASVEFVPTRRGNVARRIEIS